MRKYISTFAAITAIASGVAVLMLKMTVQSKTEDVQALVAKIHTDQEALRVLEAEWGLVSSPRRLQQYSVQFLALMPPAAKQIISSPEAVPLRPRGLDVEAETGVLLPAAHEKADEPQDKKNTKAKATPEYDL